MKIAGVCLRLSSEKGRGYGRVQSEVNRRYHNKKDYPGIIGGILEARLFIIEGDYERILYTVYTFNAPYTSYTVQCTFALYIMNIFSLIIIRL